MHFYLFLFLFFMILKYIYLQYIYIYLHMYMFKYQQPPTGPKLYPLHHPSTKHNSYINTTKKSCLLYSVCCILSVFMSPAELGSARDLITSDVTDTSFMVSWTAAPGRVRQYRIRWRSVFSEESGEKMIPADMTSTLLENLTPETRYQVSVFASYDRGEGEPLVGEETTDGEHVNHSMICYLC